MTNNLAYYGKELITIEKHFKVLVPGAIFITPHFRPKITNGPSKLERYIAIGWKGLPVTNALA